MKSILQLALCCALLVALPAQAATICVDKKDTMEAKCKMSIQGGVNAAAAGDTIKIKAGTYFEPVTIPMGKSGLIIQGSGKTIIDTAAFGAPGLTIQAPNATISGLSINNTDDHGIHVDDLGDNLTINKVSINHATGDCIKLEADVDNAKLIGNRFFQCGGNGIDLKGNTSVIGKNKFNEVVGAAIAVDGTQSTIEGNLCISTGGCVAATAGSDNHNITVKKNKGLVQASDMIVVEGDDTLIEGNSGVGLGLGFVTVTGVDPRVVSNKSKEAFDGISATCALACDGFLVERNSQTNLQAGTCVSTTADADGAQILNNTCKRVSAGYVMNGSGTEIVQGNKLINSKGDAFAAITPMATSKKTFLKNTATYAGGDGFDVNGLAATAVGHVLRDNKATKGAQDGFNFDVDTHGLQITGNTASGNIMEGFDNRGGTTAANVFNENKASKNREGSDFCNDGGMTDDITDNRFDTTALQCEF